MRHLLFQICFWKWSSWEKANQKASQTYGSVWEECHKTTEGCRRNVCKFGTMCHWQQRSHNCSKCRFRCSESISEEHRVSLCKNFYGLGDYCTHGKRTLLLVMFKRRSPYCRQLMHESKAKTPQWKVELIKQYIASHGKSLLPQFQQSWVSRFRKCLISSQTFGKWKWMAIRILTWTCSTK